MNIGKQLLRTNPQNLIMISSSLTLFTAFESLTSSYCNKRNTWHSEKNSYLQDESFTIILSTIIIGSHPVKESQY